MPVQKLKEYLDLNKVKYVTISHSPAYTAQEIAARAHIPGKELAKTVIVEIDGHLAMAVLPASFQINFDRLKEAVGADSIRLADEKEFKELFPNCDPGAMPPFGNLYEMDVFVESHLTEDDEIAFSAGSHSELVRLAYSDFEKLVHPKVGNFSMGG